jgi:AcrR family transcriptional regulator
LGAARDEITERLHREMLETGRIDRSLRELGVVVEVSARMLVYHFGSREELLQAVLRRERELQTRQLDGLLASGARPLELLERYFIMITEPVNRGRLRFLFVSRSPPPGACTSS